MELRSSTVANESSGLFLIYFNDIIIFHFKLQQKTENIVKAVNILIFITDDDTFFKHDLEIYSVQRYLLVNILFIDISWSWTFHIQTGQY